MDWWAAGMSIGRVYLKPALQRENLQSEQSKYTKTEQKVASNQIKATVRGLFVVSKIP